MEWARHDRTPDAATRSRYERDPVSRARMDLLRQIPLRPQMPGFIKGRGRGDGRDEGSGCVSIGSDGGPDVQPVRGRGGLAGGVVAQVWRYATAVKLRPQQIPGFIKEASGWCRGQQRGG